MKHSVGEISKCIRTKFKPLESKSELRIDKKLE